MVPNARNERTIRPLLQEGNGEEGTEERLTAPSDGGGKGEKKCAASEGASLDARTNIAFNSRDSDRVSM